MRKWLLLFTLLLGGCGLLIRPEPTPSPTPRPTETPIPEVRYYPTADAQTIQALLKQVSEPYQGYYQEVTSPDGVVYSIFGVTVVSSGKVETMKVGDWMLDVVWVYERNNIPKPAFYPLVVGVETQDKYIPYYVRYSGESDRRLYLKFLEEHSVLERGRFLYPAIESVKGGYVNLFKGIDWEACGDTVFCRLGQYIHKTYRLDNKLTHQMMGSFYIPEGWVLAWMWDAATDENTLPGHQKINLP